MAILWCRETVRDRQLEVAKDNGGSASRSFLVRVTDPGESLSTIRAQPGISIGDPLPDDASLACEKISVRPRDDDGMLYEVSISYKASESQSSNNDEDQPGSMDGLTPQWGASSGVSSEPVYRDWLGRVMTNSAGDPLEGLEAEVASYHLTLTQYYPTHDGENGWMPKAKEYTNSVNNAPWNGSAAGTWKCQGCSAKLNIDRQGEGGSARVYWEVVWDFASKYPDWNLHPWDIGFNELVDDSGNPVEVEGISAGDQYGGGSGAGSGSGDDGPCEGQLGRRAILGQDDKPVRQPVALQNGVAKPACQRPNALDFQIYDQRDFLAVFGEVSTPEV